MYKEKDLMKARKLHVIRWEKFSKPSADDTKFGNNDVYIDESLQKNKCEWLCGIYVVLR